MKGRIWRFADVDFDEQRRELRVAGALIDVEVKPLDVLLQLLLHAGEVVTKEELLDAVWPGSQVVDGSVATAVSKLRKALGSHQDVVVTVPRVGYRLATRAELKSVADATWPDLHLSAGEAPPARPDWRLVRQLSTTPWMEVWQAEHIRTRQSRVFKFAHDEAGLQSLKREVTVARLLQGTYGDRSDFVPVLDWNLTQAPHFIESEYVGPNLLEWVEEQGGLHQTPLPVRLRLLEDVARAVASAHALDILHKDLKPANVLIASSSGASPRVKVSDFGSAALLTTVRLGNLGITNLGFTAAGGDESDRVSGTMMYVAPEVLTGESPTPASDVFALGMLLYQLVAGDFRKPLAPGWEAGVNDPLLRDDIALAACGDPARRLQSAGELADRLSNLEHRRAQAHASTEVPPRGVRSDPVPPTLRRWLIPAALCLIAVAASGWYLLARRRTAPVAIRTVAVLPLRQIGAGDDLAYLGIALADEVATLLCDARGLGVRPVAASPATATDFESVRRIGRDMRADRVVTGRFQRSGEKLNITLEAIDVPAGRLLWQDTLSAPTDSRIGIQVQLALRVRGTLARALGGDAPHSGPEPKDERAYELFLRAAAVSSDAAPNRSAIDMLEQSVKADSGFAPAWQALAKRYYIEARYGTGGPGLLDRADAAARRALALDPGNVGAAANLTVSQVERGELASALRQAEDIVRRRPDSVEAHFSLSYVLRYAGLLEEASRHCETAFLLDQRNSTSGLRSCAVVFLLLDDYPRTVNYLQLDAGSDFERALSIHLLLRKGRKQDALKVTPPQGAGWGSYRALLECAPGAGKPRPESPNQASRPSGEPETNYFSAAHLAYCGEAQPALELLRTAIDGGYCSYPAMERDPFFAALRDGPEFARLRAAGKACQERFVTERKSAVPRPLFPRVVAVLGSQ